MTLWTSHMLKHVVKLQYWPLNTYCKHTLLISARTQLANTNLWLQTCYWLISCRYSCFGPVLCEVLVFSCFQMSILPLACVWHLGFWATAGNVLVQIAALAPGSIEQNHIVWKANPKHLNDELWQAHCTYFHWLINSVADSLYDGSPEIKRGLNTL